MLGKWAESPSGPAGFRSGSGRVVFPLIIGYDDASMNLDFRILLAPVAAWALLVAAAIVARPLLPVDETRYLAVAWEMWQRGDFLVPHLNGETYSHKPPLLFWAMHLGWAVFGVNDWWPRLVAPLFGLAALLLTFRLARQLWPDTPETAPVAAALTLGALFWTLFTTMTMFDMLHACFTLAALGGLVTAARGRLLPGFGMFGLAVGLAIVGKGPAILVHVLPAALAAPLWAPMIGPNPEWKRWYAGVAGGILLGAAVGLAWAVPAGISGGEAYRNAIFWGQSAGRMVDSFAHGRPFWWFAAILPGMALPWTAWPAAWRAVGDQARALAGDGGTRLCLIWFAAAFLVFSAISGKQPHYLIPEFPALALILARALSGAATEGGFWRRWDAWVPAGLFLALAALVAGAFHFDLKPSWATTPGEGALWPMAVLAAGAALYAVSPGSGAPARVFRMTALSAVFAVALHLTLRPILADAYDFRPMARDLKSLEDKGYSFVTFGDYHGEFHFLGRLTRPWAVVDGPVNLEKWLAGRDKAIVVDLMKDDPAATSPVAVSRYRGRWQGAWTPDRYPLRLPPDRRP